MQLFNDSLAINMMIEVGEARLKDLRGYMYDCPLVAG